MIFHHLDRGNVQLSHHSIGLDYFLTILFIRALYNNDTGSTSLRSRSDIVRRHFPLILFIYIFSLCKVILGAFFILNTKLDDKNRDSEKLKPKDSLAKAHKSTCVT